MTEKGAAAKGAAVPAAGVAVPVQGVPTWNLDDDPSEPSVPEVFLVQEQRPGWVRVLLPTRPNGSTGWLHAGDVQMNLSPYHIQVDVAAHQITVFNGTEVM